MMASGFIRMLLWCSLVEPTPCVPRRSPWYSIVRKKEIQPENSGKSPKMGVRRARSARRTHIFGIFGDVCLYNTVSPPAVYGKNGGGNPPIFPLFLHFSSLFVHYFLENVTREPPITPQGEMTPFTVIRFFIHCSVCVC